MRRFILALTSVAALAMAGSASAEDYKVLAPAAPGGGWDQTARTMQSALQDEKISGSVQVINVPGAGGTIGLAPVREPEQGRPEPAHRRWLCHGRRYPDQQIAGHTRRHHADCTPHR